MISIIGELRDFGIIIDVGDPCADAREVFEEYGLHLLADPQQGAYDGVLLAVKHREFVNLGLKGLSAFCKKGGIFYDIKEALA